MNIEDYSRLARRTANSMGSEINDLMHGAAGMAGEAGEVIDLVKKSFAYGKPLDRQKLVEEIGDCLWYINLLLDVTKASWSEVLETNITKLEVRYPDLRFNAEHAIHRDVNAEQAAMQR